MSDFKITTEHNNPTALKAMMHHYSRNHVKRYNIAKVKLQLPIFSCVFHYIPIGVPTP